MNPYQYFREIFYKTQVLKSPKRRIATFGDTRIPYFFVSEIASFKNRSRLRRGIVIAEKPKIITRETIEDRFEGFNREAREFGDWLAGQYGNAFKALEYHFKNVDPHSQVENTPWKVLSEEIEKRLTDEESVQSAIIHGPDRAWQISLLKFAMDECSASFSSNVRELEEHGFFDTPEKVMAERRRIVAELFEKARNDRALIPFLGRKLQEYGFFKEYEDRFFGLFRN